MDTVNKTRTSIILVSRNLLKAGTYSRKKSINPPTSRRLSKIANAVTANNGQRIRSRPATKNMKNSATKMAPK